MNGIEGDSRGRHRDKGKLASLTGRRRWWEGQGIPILFEGAVGTQEDEEAWQTTTDANQPSSRYLP